MKFGVREICDVVLRAKTTTKIGNRVFYKNEPVIYFDTLKTSSMEGASTTVYAQGGRGNARLMAWEGERTVTFTMEDALISTEGFMILSGAGLVDASDDNKLKVHSTLQVNSDNIDGTTVADQVSIKMIGEDENPKPYYQAGSDDSIYVFALDSHGDIIGEPFIGICDGIADNGVYTVVVKNLTQDANQRVYSATDIATLKNASAVLVDFYQEKSIGSQIEITADSFGCNFYLEASTLFRNTDGEDMPAEFIIPNCKIQSNFTFTMASSGDPSSFTFTMDAFPDYTRWDMTKKVLAAIQIISESASSNASAEVRAATNHS